MTLNALQHLVIAIEEESDNLSDNFINKSSIFTRLTGKISEDQAWASVSKITGDKRLYRNLRLFNFDKSSLQKLPIDVENMSERKKKLPNGEIVFVSGNPTVEITKGIIHIYKNAKDANDFSETTILCMFGIPSHLSVKDILIFIFPMRDLVHELKIVRDETPDRYMALLNFNNHDDASKFYNAFNASLYNNIESDKCQLIYVSHVEILNPRQACFPSKNLLELPSCPVCLERMDEPLHGILTTILCNHSFHDECISQVAETICPVCRYMQSPEIVSESQCSECSLRENLWVCLICGKVGCGRNGQGHALRHFETTGHTFSLELGKQLVWDYADDAYVHRLAMNHEDGKLVQIGEGSETGDKKLDVLSMDFGAVLTSQMESQRMYFDGELARVSCEADARFQEVGLKLARMQEVAESTKETVAQLTKENEILTKKLAQATNLARRLQNELSEERALNGSLTSNQLVWKTRAEQAERESNEVKEELHDVLVNLQMRDKLAEFGEQEHITSEEMASSKISIQQSEISKAKQRRQRKKH